MHDHTSTDCITHYVNRSVTLVLHANFNT